MQLVHSFHKFIAFRDKSWDLFGFKLERFPQVLVFSRCLVFRIVYLIVNEDVCQWDVIVRKFCDELLHQTVWWCVVLIEVYARAKLIDLLLLHLCILALCFLDKLFQIESMFVLELLLRMAQHHLLQFVLRRAPTYVFMMLSRRAWIQDVSGTCQR